MRTTNDSPNAISCSVVAPQCRWTDGSKVDLERVGKRVRRTLPAADLNAYDSELIKWSISLNS